MNSPREIAEGVLAMMLGMGVIFVVMSGVWYMDSGRFPDVQRGQRFLLTEGFYKDCTLTIVQTSLGTLSCPNGINPPVISQLEFSKSSLFSDWGAKEISQDGLVK